MLTLKSQFICSAFISTYEFASRICFVYGTQLCNVQQIQQLRNRISRCPTEDIYSCLILKASPLSYESLNCNGSSICTHNRQKTMCKVYGGCHIYEHNKVTSNCVDCGGGSICEHSKVNNICRVYTPIKYFGRFTTKKYEQNISTHSFY